MNVSELVAIDVHTHADISCRQPQDDYAQEFAAAKQKYFKSGQPPTTAATVRDFEPAGFKPEVRPLILKDNAAKLLGLDGGANTHH